MGNSANDLWVSFNQERVNVILAHVYFHLCDHISHFTLILFAIIHNASRKSFFHCEGGEGGITGSTKIRVDFTEKPFLILYNYLLSTCKMKVCEVIELYLCKWYTTVQHLYNNNSIKSFLFFIWWRYRLQKLVTRATNVLAVYQFPNK